MFGSDGTWALSQQLAMYRTMDSWERNRADDALAGRNAAWRNQYNNLMDRYNRLLHDAKRLADVQDQALDSQDRHIAELKAMNATLHAEIEKLTLDLADARTSVKLLKRLDRELHPEVYRSVYDKD